MVVDVHCGSVRGAKAPATLKIKRNGQCYSRCSRESEHAYQHADPEGAHQRSRVLEHSTDAHAASEQSYKREDREDDDHSVLGIDGQNIRVVGLGVQDCRD